MKTEFKKTKSIKKMTDKRGFSLLELVTVMAMVSIMIATVLYFIGGNKSKTELGAAANEMASTLREAQNYALTGKVVSGNNCIGYNFISDVNSSNYSIEGIGCSFNVEYKLSGNVLIENSLPATISFDVPHGNTSGGNITLIKNGNRMYVCVNSAGLIKKEKEQSDCII